MRRGINKRNEGVFSQIGAYFVLKSKLLWCILLVVLVNKNSLAQLSDSSLIQICKDQYYQDYIKKITLPNIGKDVSKDKFQYGAEEIFVGYFKSNYFYKIRLLQPHSSYLIYCINQNGVIISGNYFSEYDSLFHDAIHSLSNLDKSLLSFIIKGSNPINCIINDELLAKMVSPNSDFKKYIIGNFDSIKLSKKYRLKITKNSIEFYVYKLNFSFGYPTEIVKMKYIFEKGLIVKIEEEIIEKIEN